MKPRLFPLTALVLLGSAALAAATVLLVWKELGGPPAAERAAYAPQHSSAELPTLWAAPDFAIPSQTGKTITKASLEGHVWIASFIFTTCTAVCPMITANTVLLQRKLTQPSLRFLSFSVDPEVDTVSKLAEYARQWNADERRWLLLRPDPAELPALAEGMRVALEATDDPSNKIMHSSMFFLVDAKGAVRGVYDSNDDRALVRLVADVEELVPRHPATSAPRPAGESAAVRGQQTFFELGCPACHDNPQLAPPLAGVFRTQRTLESGEQATADRAYLQRAIVTPSSEVVAGYLKLMPSYREHLSDSELNDLVAYVEALPPLLPQLVATAPAQPISGARAADPAPLAQHQPKATAVTTAPSAAAPVTPDAPAVIAVDPVCLMRVRVTAQTPSATHQGNTHHFCADSCRKRFVADPESFLEQP
jgi:protein SCO1/2